MRRLSVWRAIFQPRTGSRLWPRNSIRDGEGSVNSASLDRAALVPALASFNLGVEIGQIAIVLLVVPALLGMDRLVASWRGEMAQTTRSAVAVYGISAVIIGLGSYALWKHRRRVWQIYDAY